jgi:uncharacterized protein with von Willebrand factor type A (vWA) domain
VKLDAEAGPRLFEQREAQLAALDRLPRSLWLGSLVNSQGSLAPRLRALQSMRETLLEGSPPRAESADWLDTALADALQDIFLQLELPLMCRDRAELTDQVLSSMLWHLDLIVDYVDRGESEDAAVARALAAFAADWKERHDLIGELEAVFGRSDDLLKNTNWDMLRGLLRSEGWQEIVRIRRLIEALPELSRLIRQLGRAQASTDPQQSNQRELQLMEQSSALRSSVRVTRVPEMPGETRGVYRSGRMARMLPSETMLLTHRRLRLVWHARHAERSLLTYEEDDHMREVVHERVPVWQPSTRRTPDLRMEAGPMLICVDTSGSMQGGPEVVAKAVVLEAMRTAHAQQRACHVFAFGGPGEIVELEVGMDTAGIVQLAQFLGQGFRGGTDVCGPIERVVERLAEERWQLADLLIASDGEFGATPGTAAALARTKTELGLRVLGVLIGDRKTPGMLELADDLYWMPDWRRYGTSDAALSMRSVSRTATYIPGGLRSETGKPTVSGGEAAWAVLMPGRDPQA